MPRSQAERLWIVGGAIVGLVMLLIGYFFFISPQTSETDDVDGQVATVQSSNDILQSKIDRLRAQNKNIAQYVSEAEAAQLALPDTNELSNFLRTLQQIGGSTRTDVTSLVARNPLDVSVIVNGVAASAADSSAPTGNAAALQTHTGAVVRAGAGPAVYALPISTVVVGSVEALNQFLTQLQSVQPRAVLVSALNETTGKGVDAKGKPTDGTVTSLALDMYAFVSPKTAAESGQLQGAGSK